jgi:hypothetical protein
MPPSLASATQPKALHYAPPALANVGVAFIKINGNTLAFIKINANGLIKRRPAFIA